MCKRIVLLVAGSVLGAILIDGAAAEWTPIGPEGGFLLSFAIAPGSPDVVYAGSDVYGGIHKSTDGGEHWEFMGMLSDLGQVLDIAIHPESSDVVYATCGQGGLFRTTTGGVHWDHVFQREDVVYGVGIDPTSPNTVYACLAIDDSTDYGLYRSTDGGASWPDSSFRGNGVVRMVFDPDSLGTAYVGTSAGVYRSTDGGSTWAFCGPPAPSATIKSLAIADFNTFYAGTYSDVRDAGAVYKTTDGGASWDTSYALGTTAWGLAIDPDSSDILYLAAGGNMFGLEGVYKTTDAGENWFPACNGLQDRMATEVRVDPLSPNIVYAATDGLGGVYRSTDRGENWTQSVTGMQCTIVQAMCFDASNTLYAATGYGTYRDIPCIFKTTDDGNTWDTLATVPSPYYMTSIWDMVAYPGSSGVIYIAGMSYYSSATADSVRGLVYRSGDAGETWDSLWTPDSLWIQCLALDTVSGNIYAGAAGRDTSICRVYRSTDGGDSWEETHGWEHGGNPISDIAVDPKSPNVLYAAAAGLVYKSTDYGENWTYPPQSFPYAYSLLIDPDSTDIVYLGAGGPHMDSGGVYKSTDAGATFSRIGLGEHPVNSLVGRFGALDVIYAGTGGKFIQTAGRGVFQSTDNGASWESINEGLVAPFVLCLHLDPHSSQGIYAGTATAGVFKNAAVGVRETPRGHSGDGEFWSSTFPNPCNAHTQIEYQIPRESHVTLEVYDVTGRSVRTLVDEVKDTGYYRVEWDGRGAEGGRVASGVYFYRIEARIPGSAWTGQAGAYTATQKMVLVR